MEYDLIIIGGGPAGAAAGVYAARKQIKTLLVAESFGGQSVESEEIQNWIGTPAISGIELAKKLKEHVKFYAGKFVEIKEGERAEEVEKTDQGFSVKTNKETYDTKTILISSGSSRKKLDIAGASEFEGKGISYCASCDGLFFADKNVAIIGGGNAGFESAAQLLAYCKSVTLMSRGDFRADPVTIEKVLANPKMTALANTTPIEIKGDNFVKSLIYKKNEASAKNVEIEVDGIFVEIGHIPSTGFAEPIGIKMNEFKNIIVDHKNQRTNIKGIWASGDCTDGLYHQNNIAVGDAIKALEDIYLELQKIK
ncbi:MAG: FAD-dependent oxidoreductase [Candidatus Paceibacterota bacterium]|jgi:alkyl hydroperoxide reductase subunit F